MPESSAVDITSPDHSRPFPRLTYQADLAGRPVEIQVSPVVTHDLELQVRVRISYRVPLEFNGKLTTRDRARTWTLEQFHPEQDRWLQSVRTMGPKLESLVPEIVNAHADEFFPLLEYGRERSAAWAVRSLDDAIGAMRRAREELNTFRKEFEAHHVQASRAVEILRQTGYLHADSIAVPHEAALSPEERDAVHLAAQFWPVTDTECELPATTVFGAMTFTYLDRNTKVLRVSVDLETVDASLRSATGKVPLRITVDDETVYEEG